MDPELLQQVAREWLGRPLDDATKTARRLSGLLAELRAAERSAEAPAFGFEPVGGQRMVAGRGPSAGALPFGGAPERAEALAEQGAVALTRAALERIAQEDRLVNAFVARLDDRALAQAKAVETALQRGEYPGPLAGMHVAVKDLIDVADLPTTACSPMRVDAIAESDAVVTTRLAEAGAILLGKTATHEWAYGTTCESRLHGTTRNPVAPAHSPGGSSGGSAAAVAAGLVAGALGTDTAGSLRIPAACCGVVGFKPTFGRVSREGVLPLSHSLDHVGPIGKDVATVALLDAVIAEAPAKGATGWGQIGRTTAGELVWHPATPASLTIEGLRIGLPEGWLNGPLDAGVAASFQAALDRLRDRGAEILPVAAPSLELGQFISRILTLAEGATVHAANLDRLGEYPPDVRARLELGQFILARDYLLAQQLRTRYSREMAEAMAGIDLLVTPTQPIPAPLLEQRLWTYGAGIQESVADALTRFVAPANVTGQPALSLPCGRTPEELPVGLQLMGHPGGDHALLAAAALIEGLLGG